MYLKRLEIQGFKSFAGKTELEFLPPRGGLQSITAVVGPNGAGKSNIVDALRWAMGETSLKSLRGKKSEDVIFGGSPARGALGVAEVTMTLQNLNANGHPERLELGEEFPLGEASDITITRRLYRSGEGEYLINQQLARLLDVHLLLAKLQFAQHSYSVVSQGTIDRLLTVGPGERKDWFDEACGIKEYQLKQHQAELKLNRTRVNMRAAEGLLSEVEPRLRLLGRQVRKLEKRQQVEVELAEAQEQYYAALAGNLEIEIKSLVSQASVLEAKRQGVAAELLGKQTELDGLASGADRSESFRALQAEYQAAERAKQATERELMRLQSQLEAEYRQQGASTISWLEGGLSDARAREVAGRNKLEQARAQAEAAARRLAEARARLEKLNRQAEDLKKKVGRGSSALPPALGGADQLWVVGETARSALAEATRRFGQVAELSAVRESSTGAYRVYLLPAARPAPEETEALVQFSAVLSLPDTEAAAAEAELAALERERTSAQAATEAAAAAEQSSTQAAAFLAEEFKSLEAEAKRLERELSLAQASPEQYGALVAALGKDKTRLIQELSAQAKTSEQLSQRLAQFNEEEEAKKRRIFGAQSELQAIQAALNQVVAEQNERRVDLAKLETRQEDLEREVEHELKTSLTSLFARVPRPAGVVPGQTIAAGAEAIEKLKYQLSLIGGIEAEVVEEHSQTKERHEFLTTQLADLRAATGDLEALVAELAELMKHKRAAIFKQIRKEFDRYFKILFAGGSADLEEVYGEAEAAEAAAEENEAGDTGDAAFEAPPAPGKREKILTGIEVKASPPGKKIKHLGALSGGERTLTSIALICAILHTNPAPFVVLDEVEAALDESNTLRFTSILKELATRSQFIIVTHNRVTMHAADALYGVVMGGDGASKLLSVKLDQAADLAEPPPAARS